jgi:3-oxoacyl-[acyl-carrier-protein] synthase II
MVEIARDVQGVRVAVTGIGVVSCAGVGVEDFWRGLFAPAPLGERRVHSFDAGSLLGEKELRRVDRFAQMALVAADEAITMAGGKDSLLDDPELVGSIVGTGIGGVSTLEREIIVNHEKGSRRVSPFLVPMMMGNAGAAGISMHYGFQGPAETIVTACASGPHAIGAAARLVASGRCDVVIAGASEAGMTPTGMAGFRNMTAMSGRDISQPFAAERDGFVISEGAGILVLESEEHAARRSAKVLSWLVGAASTADAHHITAPAPGGRGAIACMRRAIADAGLTPADIGYINAHGTSTPRNDATEAEAMVSVFGTDGPWVSSTKGVTGHSLAASGAAEAVACVLAILRRQLPPTWGTTQLDPALAPIRLITQGDGVAWEPSSILSNSFGFGGHNGSLVISPA